MAQQVSGSDLTLLEAIRQEIVPTPALMRWNAWQQWRATAGLRPRKARDGIEVPNVQEAAYYKSVMAALYGEAWAVELATQDVTEETTEADPLARESSLEPAAAAGHPTEESPGSGQPGEPGSGVKSPGSWDSDHPGTSEEVTERIFKPFRPGIEALSSYVNTIKRQARVR